MTRLAFYALRDLAIIAAAIAVPSAAAIFGAVVFIP